MSKFFHKPTTRSKTSGFVMIFALLRGKNHAKTYICPSITRDLRLLATQWNV